MTLRKITLCLTLLGAAPPVAMPQTLPTGEVCEQECEGLRQSARAAVLAVSGRFAEAAGGAESALAILEKTHPVDDPILFRPLHTLTVARFALGESRKAWVSYRRLLGIRTGSAQDRALAHGLTAYVLHNQHKFAMAASEYGQALDELAAAGRGYSADSAAMQVARARVIMEDGKFDLARGALDRAATILASAPDAVTLDRIGVQEARGLLHALRHEWGGGAAGHAAISRASRPGGGRGHPKRVA